MLVLEVKIEAAAVHGLAVAFRRDPCELPAGAAQGTVAAEQPAAGPGWELLGGRAGSERETEQSKEREMLVGSWASLPTRWALEFGREKITPSPEYSTEVILTFLLPLRPPP